MEMAYKETYPDLFMEKTFFVCDFFLFFTNHTNGDSEANPFHACSGTND